MSKSVERVELELIMDVQYLGDHSGREIDMPDIESVGVYGRKISVFIGDEEVEKDMMMYVDNHTGDLLNSWVV